MFLGLDFGTSNSSAAVYDGQQIRYIPLDPANGDDPHVLSSMLYVSSEGQRLFGRRAISEYLERTAGRTVSFERKDYGDIEMTFGDLTHVAQGYYMEEKEMPGRFFQYLKKHVDSDISTNVFGSFYKPHELVSLILKHIKGIAEQFVQQEIEGVVLGRPVKFSDIPRKNIAAATNLQSACHSAGFSFVEFQYEPVAAAFNYARTARQSENILIFDFGGGTFDVTIVNAQDKQARVLGLDGVPVGGSDFDKSLMFNKIAPHFGRGTIVDGGRTAPTSIFLELLEWQTIVNLNRNRRFLKTLEDCLFYAEDPAPFKALRRLVKEDHGFAIFQAIEQAKKRLSSRPEATVSYHVPELFEGEGAIELDQPISRREFERLLTKYSEKIFAAIDEAMKSAGLKTRGIHRVIRVGGSSRIPFFHKLLAQKFGGDKLMMQDEFKNVAAGLALNAYEKTAG
ncbi:MAG: Hsp70 family protein [bacterium]|nr:Hsp70 family protein [bacterium]